MRFLSARHHFLLLVISIFSISGCVHTEHSTQTASTNVALGLAYIDQNDMSRAQSKLASAYAENPKAVEVLDALGYYYERTGNFSEAKQYYRDALKSEGSQSVAANNYGRFLCRTKQYAEGQKYLLRAAEDVNYLHRSVAFENAGWCAAAMGDCVLAKHYFERALQQDPMSQVAHAENCVQKTGSV